MKPLQFPPASILKEKITSLESIWMKNECFERYLRYSKLSKDEHDKPCWYEGLEVTPLQKAQFLKCISYTH